ncbi:MAG: tRNA uridine-5-carboxymethylaminomethyl(34) synthesis GTPase MnmE [Candidatus Coatesbacteria bacterium]|nr:MAG: tRNA uridine-5-carboxymethylaminomethyl(34) synthesis GTPase MnmE [Candidatus Coatesbacteria bacterium]
MSENNIIVAEATPRGVGAISIVRLSGDNCFTVAKSFMSGLPEDNPPESGKVCLVNLVDGEKVIDKATVVFYKSPYSYTGEDMVEIFCHGSPAIVSTIVSIAESLGARRARAGEFTKRAFINGKVDIITAEAINSLTRSMTKVGSSIAMSVMKGNLKTVIGDISKGMLLIQALIEAIIEYEEDIPVEGTMKRVNTELNELIKQLQRIEASYGAFKVLSGGANVVIVGRKNAGKTTLFNRLLGYERGIVSEHPGTTRDYIREPLHLGDDYLIYLTDIAGLGEVSDDIDMMATESARGVISNADILVFLVDVQYGWGGIEDKILGSLSDKEIVYVVSRADLCEEGVVKVFKKVESITGCKPIVISSITMQGIDELRERVRAIMSSLSKIGTFLVSERQRELVWEMIIHLKRVVNLIERGEGIEMVAEEMRCAIRCLELFEGRGYTDEMIDKIFEEFCVGK